MNELRQQATDYLHIRRALGFKLRGHDRLLEDFIDYLERAGSTTITGSVNETEPSRSTSPPDPPHGTRIEFVRARRARLAAADPAD